MREGNRLTRVVRRAAATAFLGVSLAALALAATTPAVKKHPASTSGKPGTAARRPAARSKGPSRSPLEIAFNARNLEDAGAYGQAADQLKSLRGKTKRDVDLEIALALDLARSGQPDSALAILSSKTLEAAANDSMPIRRRAEYPYGRETMWVNGVFDGWNWYILRARAELEAKKGRWKEAAAWAGRATEAWALSGKDWHILAVCAEQAGEDDVARRANAQATLLDSTIPEAWYMAGLWAWRDGKRSDALADFRRAVRLDSSYQAPALAMIKARLPGAQPDPFPKELFTGFRQAALLTSPVGPKPEEFVQMDTPASLDIAADTAVVDSIPPGVHPFVIVLSLLVNDQGMPVLTQLPWYEPSRLDFRKVIRIINSVPAMRFTPATRFHRPSAVWVSIDYNVKP